MLAGCQDCFDWLAECGAVVIEEDAEGAGGWPATAAVDCKASTQLVMPEVKAKEAHGDANLTVTDFLKAAFV